MPIFEYRCRRCGAEFEQLVFSAEGTVACPRCSGAQVDKLLSVFAVSGGGRERGVNEPGPCPCGAPRRGMCGE